MKIAIRLALITGIIVLWAAAAILLLAIVDRILIYDSEAVRGSIGDPTFTSSIDPARPYVTVNTFDLYPWTGGHTQANARLHGGKFQTGKHGFFVDFDLDNPPPKEPGEIRVLWVGGSGAAGWGATNNEHMLYRIIERELTSRCRRRVRVVNLAMGGSITYQNFIALNLWGHALEPDMIVSFSGHNDMRRPYDLGASVWNGYWEARGLLLATRRDTLRSLEWLYPGIMNSMLGLAARTLLLPSYIQAGKNAYFGSFGGKEENGQPAYIHALKSIERDFPGAKMVLISQPYMLSPTMPWHYELIALAQNVRDQLSTHWSVHDGNALYWSIPGLASGDGVHMTDDTQNILGPKIARWLESMLCR